MQLENNCAIETQNIIIASHQLDPRVKNCVPKHGDGELPAHSSCSFIPPQHKHPIPAGHCIQHVGAAHPDGAAGLWAGGGASFPVEHHSQEVHHEPLLLQGRQALHRPGRG